MALTDEELAGYTEMAKWSAAPHNPSQYERGLAQAVRDLVAEVRRLNKRCDAYSRELFGYQGAVTRPDDNPERLKQV